MFDRTDIDYCVVINREEQYSIWPTDREIPGGWVRVGPSGTKAVCLEYVREVWRDITPKSLRQGASSDDRL